MKNKKYLYIDRYYIPQTLLPFLQDVTEQDARYYSFCCSVILVFADELTCRANIHWTVFNKKIGNNYNKYLDDLIHWNIIGVQLNEDGKETYSCNNPNGNNFSKCYYWTEPSLESGGILVDFRLRQAPKQYTLDENIINNDIKINDPIINYTVKVIDNLEDNYNLDDVKIRNQFIHYLINKRKETKEIQKNTYKHHMPRYSNVKIIQNANKMTYFNIFAEQEQRKLVIGEWWLKKLYCKNYSVKISDKSMRCYHPIISMPSQTREFIWYNNCNTKVYYDIKSCFPVLLTKYVDATEKDKYKNYLDNDIYTSIKPDDRQGCKKEFQRFINGNVNNYVKKWFKLNLPLTYQYIASNYKNMAMELQQTESKIMVHTLIPTCIEKNIPNILVMHDGWMSDGSNTEQELYLINLVKELFYNSCGYVPTIKKEIRTRQIEIYDDEPTCCLDNL